MSSSKDKLPTSPLGTHYHNGRAVNLELASFCIFNASLGQKEGEEEEKIFLYFPASTDIDVKIRQIGVLEAVAKFVRSFGDTDCRSFLTSQQLYVLLQAEPDFWMSMTFTLVHPADSMGPRVEENDRTRNETIQDEVYCSILEKAYKMYKILNGPLSLEQGTDEDIRRLKQKLLTFFSDYLQKTPFGQMDVLQCFDALQWLPLERKAFLAVQNFVNLAMMQFTEVRHCLMLYWDQVVWNDIDLPEAFSFVQYITKFLYADLMEKDIQATQISSPLQFAQGHLGRFLSGPRSLQSEDEVPPTFAYLTDPVTGLSTRFRIVLYSCSSIVICLFLHDDIEVPLETIKYFRNLDNCLGPALTTLAPELSDQHTKQRNPQWAYESPNVRYVYLNESNLSKRQTFVDRNQTVQVEVLKALVGLSDDVNSRLDDTEIYAKVLHDCWIYGKKNFQRSLYAVVTQRNADLVLAEDEMRKLCIREFPASSDAYL